MNDKRKVGISLRIVNAANYDEKRDALSHDWISFFEKFNAIPILIPNTISNVDEFLDTLEIEGVILSGGEDVGKNIERDKTETKIIEYGIKKEIPMFGVCRGMQILNNFFGGSITKTDSENHVNKSHLVEIVSPFFISMIKKKSIEVNSFHNNIIVPELLGSNLTSFAFSPTDNTIEGFFHQNLPIMAVMWHPERLSDKNSEIFFKEFFSKRGVKNN